MIARRWAAHWTPGLGRVCVLCPRAEKRRVAGAGGVGLGRGGRGGVWLLASRDFQAHFRPTAARARVSATSLIWRTCGCVRLHNLMNLMRLSRAVPAQCLAPSLKCSPVRRPSCPSRVAQRSQHSGRHRFPSPAEEPAHRRAPVQGRCPDPCLHASHIQSERSAHEHTRLPCMMHASPTVLAGKCAQRSERVTARGRERVIDIADESIDGTTAAGRIGRARSGVLTWRIHSTSWYPLCLSSP